MAVAHVQSNNSNGSGTSLGVTISAIGSGNTIVGAVSYDGAGTLNSVTDNASHTYTLVNSTTDTGNNQKNTAFFLGNITGGGTVITANFAGSTGALTLDVSEYTGAAALADPTDGHTGNYQPTPGTTANAIVSGNITPATNGCMIWGATMGTGGQAAAFSVGTSPNTFTSRTVGTGTVQTRAQDFFQTTAATIQATFTQAAAGATVTFVIAIKPPTADAAPSVGWLMPSAIPQRLFRQYDLNQAWLAQPTTYAVPAPPATFTASSIPQVRNRVLIY